MVGTAFRNCSRHRTGTGRQKVEVARWSTLQSKDLWTQAGWLEGQRHLSSTALCNHRLGAQVLCSSLSAFSWQVEDGGAASELSLKE